MNCVFTIVAKNYIGLAQVLEKSVKAHNADIDFYIFVADEFSTNMPSIPANVLEAKSTIEIEEDLWYSLAFKYNLVEFCTCIKPSCFNYLFNKKQYSKVIFLDPDVYLFNSLTPIFRQLQQHSIILTPHVCVMQANFTGNYSDYHFLINGTFNLGFIALANNATSIKMLSWWHERLLKQCFVENDEGTSTDQKWMSLLPSFFNNDELLITKDFGLNVAPWNFHERKVLQQENTLFVTNRIEDSASSKLLFVHFSGFNYIGLLNNNVAHKLANFDKYADLNVIFDKYTEALKESNFANFISLSYSYGSYTNGKIITSLNRRIYRTLIENEVNDLGNPFNSNNKFYTIATQKGLVENTAVSSDKQTHKNIKNFQGKIKNVQFVFRLLKTILGVKRYSILIRFLKRFFKEENQSFLFNNSKEFPFK